MYFEAKIVWLPIKYLEDLDVYLDIDVTFQFSRQVLFFSYCCHYGNQLNESLPCNTLWTKLESEEKLPLCRCDILFRCVCKVMSLQPSGIYQKLEWSFNWKGEK